MLGSGKDKYVGIKSKVSSIYIIVHYFKFLTFKIISFFTSCVQLWFDLQVCEEIGRFFIQISLAVKRICM